MKRILKGFSKKKYWNRFAKNKYSQILFNFNFYYLDLLIQNNILLQIKHEKYFSIKNISIPYNTQILKRI